MLRRISYRTAATAFVFTGLWFVLGLIALWSPAPGALGIGGAFFGAWAVLFLLALGAAGGALVLAAVNGIFPPNVRAPTRAERLWAPPQDAPQAPLPRRPGADPRRRPRARTRG